MLKKIINNHKKGLNWFTTGLILSLSLYSTILNQKPAISADRVAIGIPVIGDVYISVADLEAFAKDGTINPDFRTYAKYLKPEQLNKFQKLLQKRFSISPVLLSRALNSPMSKLVLERLGNIIKIDHNVNGFYAIRAALILSAADSEQGLTVINFLKNFSAKDVRIESNGIFKIANELEVLGEYKDAVVSAIASEATSEAGTYSNYDFSQLPDPRIPGPYQYTKETKTFQIQGMRPTQLGLASSYPLYVDFYTPTEITKPLPLIIVTHGFGSNRESYAYIAEHLVSQGFIVAAPEHIGSNLEYRDVFLKGELGDILSPIEYISRSLDITYLIDQLELMVKQDPQWAKKVDLDNIGVIGNSFGGTTSLALAGASINKPRLDQDCNSDSTLFSISLNLQCYASYLPPGDYSTKEPRIKAAYAAYPLSSSIFGPEGMAQIDIPTFILSGSKDIMAPTVTDQVYPYLWMQQQPKYLGLMVGGTHFATSLDATSQKLPPILKGPDAKIGRAYFQGTSTVFFKYYLGHDERYLPYLSEDYAKVINQEAMPLYLINSLTAQQLEQAYNGKPPIPIQPQPVIATEKPRATTIVQEIKQTGILKVGMRQDATPFGYISPEGQWEGYCEALSKSLASYLAKSWGIPDTIQIAKIPSSLDNRYDLVKNGSVHLECGPDSIRDDISGVTFSNSFFVAGNRLLVKKEQAAQIEATDGLVGVDIGVLKNSVTADVINEKYPKANITTLEGVNAREQGVEAVTKGKLDAFASDGILLIGELDRQGLTRDDYALIPEHPLSCDYYGLALPSNDLSWKNTINEFLRDQNTKNLEREWFMDIFNYEASNIDFCINRQGK